jgi:hypothetical protein
VLTGTFAASDAPAQVVCTAENTITANVVVLDNPTVFNRLGAQNPNWITYALRRDVVFQNRANPNDQDNGTPITQLSRADLAGNVELRPDKRTRPLVVRSVAGYCLTVNFQNLLTGPNQGQGHAEGANPNPPQQDPLFNDDQVRGRCAGFHASGVELVNVANETGTPIGNDGSFVGKNHAGDDVAANCDVGDRKGSLVGPGGSITYNLYTPHEGAYVVNSYGATLGSEQSSGNLGMGMFAQLNVEPPGSRIYRSQVTEEEMRLATVGTVPSDCAGPSQEGNWHGVDCNPGGQPIIDYEKIYPNVAPWIAEGKAGLPILNMQCTAGTLAARACWASWCTATSTRSLPAPTGTGRSRTRPTRWRAWTRKTPRIPTALSPSASSPRSSTTSRPTRRSSRSGTKTRCWATPLRA